jgi:hypothetical protein
LGISVFHLAPNRLYLWQFAIRAIAVVPGANVTDPDVGSRQAFANGLSAPRVIGGNHVEIRCVVNEPHFRLTTACGTIGSDWRNIYQV